MKVEEGKEYMWRNPRSGAWIKVLITIVGTEHAGTYVEKKGQRHFEAPLLSDLWPLDPTIKC